MAKGLVSGATGFVGKRLVLHLLEEGTEEKPNLHFIWGDLRDPRLLEKSPVDVQAAYYLVHSMAEIVQ
jgi:uncharacterized protein YbjT (DUF2867 family)